MVDYKELLRATNGGLDIIAVYYPEAPHAINKTDHKFKIREERTASASIRLRMHTDVGEQVYMVTDFGGDKKERHAVQIAMLEDNLTFAEACSMLGFRHGVSNIDPKIQTVEPLKEYRDIKAEETGASDIFHYLEEPDDDLLKRVFGPLVKPEHLDFCNLKQVESYTIFRKAKAITITPTADCPIYVFDFGDWRKIYTPWVTDKKYKFSYSGNKPQKFVFGLDALEEEYIQRKRKRNAQLQAGSLSDAELRREWRPDCMIMSGGSDGINMFSTNDPDSDSKISNGRFPIWFNSESEILSSEDYKNLTTWCGNIYYVADLDKTGRRQAHATGLKFLDIKLVFLPQNAEAIAHGSKPIKDFKDFVKQRMFPGKEAAFQFFLQRILGSSMPLKFWYHNPKNDVYTIAHSQAFQFLSMEGIGKIEDLNLQEGFRFIHVDGNVVRDVDSVRIETKLLSFINERNLPIKLRDLFIKSGQLSAKQLNKLPYVELDFQTTGEKHQYFFFKNKVVRCEANKLVDTRHGDGDIYTWENKVLNFNYREEKPFYRIFHDANGDLDIEILRHDCMFFNFLINTSRVHWKAELEDYYEDPTCQEAVDYHKKFRYCIDGPNLSPEEIQEQKLHLINKIYTLGYLYHEHKEMNRAYAIFAMDHKIGENGESNGGSGKSLALGQQKRFLTDHYAPARNRRSIEENQFVYDGVTSKTDYVLFDDAHKYFSIDFIFSEITNGMRVNPKHGTPFEIPFSQSPKFVITSNYAPSLDRSTERRLLFCSFSDYYHHQRAEDDGEYLQTRTVADDFDGVEMFSSWSDDEYNRYMNFIMQGVQFKLRHPDKVNPPMGNVSKRNLLHEMGDNFVNWANEKLIPSEEVNTYNELLDHEVDKKVLYDQFIQDTSTNSNSYSTSRFKKNVHHWCKYNGWKFNPQELHTDKKQGRIMRNLNGKNVEMLYIQTKDTVNPAQSDQEALDQMWNQDANK